MGNTAKLLLFLFVCFCVSAQTHRRLLIPHNKSSDSSSATFDWGGPVIRYEIDQGLGSPANGDLLTSWTNQGTWPITAVVGTPGPRWFTTYVESTNNAFANFPGGYIAKHPTTVMAVMKVIRDNDNGGTPGMFGINGSMIGVGTGWTFSGWIDLYSGVHLDTGSKVFTNNDAFFLLTVVCNGANSSIRVNGLEKNSGNAGTSDFGDGTYTGGIGHVGYNAFSFVNAQYKRFVVWTNALSLTFLTNAEKQCLTNFNLP